MLILSRKLQYLFKPRNKLLVCSPFVLSVVLAKEFGPSLEILYSML